MKNFQSNHKNESKIEMKVKVNIFQTKSEDESDIFFKVKVKTKLYN